jgi:hypothetical protein
MLGRERPKFAANSHAFHSFEIRVGALAMRLKRPNGLDQLDQLDHQKSCASWAASKAYGTSI